VRPWRRRMVVSLEGFRDRWKSVSEAARSVLEGFVGSIFRAADWILKEI